MGPENSTSNVEYIWSILDIPHVLSAYQILELLQNPIQNSGCQKARVQQIGSKTKHVTQFVLSVSIDGIDRCSVY